MSQESDRRGLFCIGIEDGEAGRIAGLKPNKEVDGRRQDVICNKAGGSKRMADGNRIGWFAGVERWNG